MQVTLTLSSLWVVPGLWLAIAALLSLWAVANHEEAEIEQPWPVAVTGVCMLVGAYACWLQA